MFTDIYVAMQGANVLQQGWREEAAQERRGWVTTLLHWASTRH